MISGASGYQLTKIISAYGYQDCLETVIKTVDYQSKGLALESILKLLGAGKRSLKQGLPVIILQDEELMRKIKKLSEKEELECLSKSVLEYFAPFQETTSNDGEYEETEDEWVDA